MLRFKLVFGFRLRLGFILGLGFHLARLPIPVRVMFLCGFGVSARVKVRILFS